MARIEALEAISKDRPKVHGLVRCTYFDFIGPDNKRYLTLDTYGSDSRDMPNKVSQSLQLDEGAALQLIKVIKRTFPGIRQP